ncbi:MAG: hypothetical protein CME08_06800 [Gemmatimonadetes bacterium]|nr:hypothetical protein [Gemmatimonadota bacterium]
MAKIAWIYLVVGGITGCGPTRAAALRGWTGGRHYILFSPNFGLAGAEAAADIMAEALGWDAPRKIKELAQYRDRELAAEHAPPSEDG